MYIMEESGVKLKKTEIQFLLEVAGEFKSYFSKEESFKNIFILQFIHPYFLAEIQFLSNNYEN